MSTQNTHAIQVWPSGKSYEYEGDPFSGAPWRTRPSGERDERINPWTDAHCIGGHWAEIRTDLRARRIQEQDILKCDSSLVADMLSAAHDLPDRLGDEWELENVTNLYPDPSEWDSAQCLAWLDEHISASDIETEYRTPQNGDPEYWINELQALARDNAEPAEVYEWWAVTKWLAEKLEEIGEPVLSNSYGHWWGRTCTGQAMIMDGTLQRVAAAIETA
jgi:hypothetical protein